MISEQTGIIFNDQMDDFAVSGVINLEGMMGSPANIIKPKKQPMSSVSPTIIVDADKNVRMAIGAAGGTKINSAVALVTLTKNAHSCPTTINVLHAGSTAALYPQSNSRGVIERTTNSPSADAEYFVYRE